MTLTMLGPVHVGSGETLGPLDYIVREEADGVIWFYAIDAGRIVGAMTDRQRIEMDSASRGGGASPAIRRFVHAQFDPQRHVLWQCQADEVLLRAAQVQQAGGRGGAGGRGPGGRGPGPGGGDRGDAVPAVLSMARTGPRREPYLPGSSIKGAIRTAWLWQRAGGGEVRPGLAAQVPQMRGDIFEAEVLGYRVQLGEGASGVDTADPHADPLRSLRVRDAMLVRDSNVIERVMLYKGETVAAEPIFCDATFSALEDEPITATGELTLYTKLQHHAVPEGLVSESGRRWRWPRAVAEPVEMEALLEACRGFYQENLHREHEQFYKPNQYLRPVGEKLIALAGQLGPNEALLRVGRFSHLENMTVRPYAERTSRTRGLAGALRPMGWVKMAVQPI